MSTQDTTIDVETEVQLDAAEANGSTQDTDAETTTPAEAPKREKKEGSYTVFQKVGVDTYKLIAKDVAARNDTQAIDAVVAEDDAETHVAVPRWVERTPTVQTKTTRKWS